MEETIRAMREALELVEMFLTSDGEDEEMWQAEVLAAVRKALKK